MQNLKKRFHIHNLKLTGDQASADAEAAKNFVEQLKEIVSSGQYAPQQIFNTDETGLYWKKLPSRTYTWGNIKRVPGFKLAKERVTVLLCSNAAGSCMLMPLLIHTSAHPRSMKNIDMSKLPVLYRHNQKAWMTTTIFEDWFYNLFVPSVEQYMREENLSFKVLLLLNNATSHSKQLSHPNIKIIFLPPNTTSLIQPLDQGIIRTMKAIYIRKTFEILSDRYESDNSKTIIELTKELTIYDCVKMVSSACNEIKQSTLNACWRKLLPQVVYEENTVPPADEQYNSIINAASPLSGDGIADMNFEDVDELFQHPSLNPEDFVELVEQSTTSNSMSINNTGENMNDTSSSNTCINGIEKIIELIKQTEHNILKYDSSILRSGKSRRELQAILLRYEQLLAEKKKEKESDETSVSTNNLRRHEHMDNEYVDMNKENEPPRPLKKRILQQFT